MSVGVSHVGAVFRMSAQFGPPDAAHCPLPNGQSMEDSSGGQKRSLQAGTSSPPKRPGMEGVVDMSVLRQLLADQAAMIMESQRQHLDQVLGGRDAEVDARFARVEDRMTAQEGTMQQVKVMVESLAKQGSSGHGEASTAVPDRGGPDRSRYTLVWGGWERETRRQVIFSDLQVVLGRLRLQKELDSEPFTTGARRSVALCNFAIRPGEGDRETRQRMPRIVRAFAEGDSKVGQLTLWCSYSRAPAERRRAGHASMLKKVLKEHFPHHLDRLDLEFSSGTAWLGESRIASASDARPEGHDRDYFIVLSKPERPWVNLHLMGKELGIPMEKACQMLTEATR